MKCKKCGNCCHQGNLWEEGLTKEEKERLLYSRRVYSVVTCGMLVFENDIAVCLVKKVLGFFPKVCEKYYKCGVKNGEETKSK